MLSAIVVDDEQLTMERICSLLHDTGQVKVIGGYTNPIEAMEEILSRRPDAVFLDIEMPQLTGLQIAEKIYESEFQSEVVFITAYNEYALDAFKVNALDYILKPVSATELKKTIDRVERRRVNLPAPGVKTQTVKVSAFGGFNVWVNDNEESIKWFTAKCRELVAYFVIQDGLKEVSKWKLIELLWPDRDSEKGYINLRSTLSRANKTLNESGSDMRIVSKRNSYILKIGSMTVDALEMRSLALDTKGIEKSSQSKYEAAITSYIGSLFEGYEYPWCEELRANYQRYFSIICRRLAEYYIEQLNDQFAALNTVEAWLKHEPYNEEAHFMALKLNHMTSGRAAADSYFHRLRCMLKDDLGIVPSLAVRELYSDITQIK